MAEEKRYWWLKLEEGTFNRLAMRKLRNLEDGAVCTIVYLKMQLESLSHGCMLIFDHGEKDDREIIENLALILDESQEDVRRTVEFLEKNRLLVKLEAVEGMEEIRWRLPEAEKSVVSEGASAERVRRFRAKERAAQEEQEIENEQAAAPLTARDYVNLLKSGCYHKNTS